MPTHYQDDEDRLDVTGDREISLGTGTILGIFLALAVVCSLFFGLGYSMGRKSVPSTASATAPLHTSAPLGESDQKPSSATPASSFDLQVSQPTEPDQRPDQRPDQLRADTNTSDPSVISSFKPGAHPRPQTAKPPAVLLADTTPSPDIAAGGPQVYVQIAAVSRREDADLLLTALRRRGYTGLIRPQTQDKLLHIQVGPFPGKKDAEAVRQRLVTDGYNPILK